MCFEFREQFHINNNEKYTKTRLLRMDTYIIKNNRTTYTILSELLAAT